MKTPFSIEKHTGGFCSRDKLRMQVKAYKYSDDMHKFLNKQTDNRWTVSSKGLASGTYAYIAGAWRDVKKLDRLTLAHC